MADVRWLGFDWRPACSTPPTTSSSSTTMRRAADPAGQGLRRRPDAGRDPRVPRHAHRAGPEQPVSRPPGRRRTSTCSRGCGPASSPTARWCCAPRSTWRRRTSTCATRCSTASGACTHHRTGDAWCIYPMYDFAHPISDAIEGITHSLCTLEFEDHRPLYDWFLDNLPVPSTPAADRVRPPEPHLHGDEQAQAAAARRREARRRLGRSAHADHRRPAPARLHAGGDPRLLRARRRRQEGQHHRRGAARALRARGSEPPRAARDGGAAAAQGGHRELSRRPGRGARGGQQPRGPGGRHAPGAVHARALHRAGRLPRGSAEEVLPPRARASEVRLRYGYIIKCVGVVKAADGDVTELRCTYDPRRAGGDAADGRKVQGDDPLGVGGARAATPRCGSTIGCSRASGPAPATPTS